MPRLNQLDDVLFSVEEHPVFVSIRMADAERRLPVPDKKAIVNRDNGRVLGVVSRAYRLVSNREALDLARECCRTVFPETKPGEWEVRSIDAPATGGHCFIDLAHNSTTLDFTFVPAKDRPEAFGPFIRVTNSYNGLRALAFDIGFYRKVCKNGMILPESVIRFKYTHARREIGETIQFEIAHERLAKARASFGKYLQALRDCKAHRAQIKQLVTAVLAIRRPKSARPGTRELEDWKELQNHLEQMCDRYVADLGENAYAALNVMTEFASHPPENRCVYRERHSFQRRSGAWLNEFNRVCSQPSFNLDEYLVNLEKSDCNGRESVAHGRRT